MTVHGYIPTDTGYVPVEELSDAERQKLSRRLADRLGAALTPHITKGGYDGDFSGH